MTVKESELEQRVIRERSFGCDLQSDKNVKMYVEKNTSREENAREDSLSQRIVVTGLRVRT